MLYRDRSQAGVELARHLSHFRGRVDALVLAVARGGVPVAVEIARVLGLPLDGLVVRKLCLPGMPGFVIGAVASGGIEVINPMACERSYERAVRQLAREARYEVEHSDKAFWRRVGPPRLRDKSVILVDDGISTGSTMRAALLATRPLGPRHVTVAVPVADQDVCEDLARQADIVCPHQVLDCPTLADYYLNFSPVTDSDVRELLESSTPAAR